MLRSATTVFIWAACVVLTVLAGPFGSYDTMAWPERLLYWGLVISAGLVLGLCARGVMFTVLGQRRPVLFDLGAALCVGVTLGPLVWVLRGALDPMLSHADLSLGSITLNTSLIILGVFVMRRKFGMETPSSYLGHSGEEDGSIPRLHRRLSLPPEAEILRLSGRDHFVEVVTDAGTETLRLRLTDAVDEMEPVPGLCTHRSHWVALSAIDGTARESGGKLFVILRNGERIPVSRKYRPALEALDLIEPS